MHLFVVIPASGPDHPAHVLAELHAEPDELARRHIGLAGGLAGPRAAILTRAELEVEAPDALAAWTADNDVVAAPHHDRAATDHPAEHRRRHIRLVRSEAGTPDPPGRRRS